MHLLDLADRGLHPKYSIADGGNGLRAGQRAAWPGVPCHGDVFHPLREFGQLAGCLAGTSGPLLRSSDLRENRAQGLNTALQRLERKMGRAKEKGRGNTLSKKLAIAREEEAKAAELARDLRTLADWMPRCARPLGQNDILSLAGPDLASRRELFDFVVEELRARGPLCSHRIRPVRRSLENQRDDLLAFVGVMDGKLADVAGAVRRPSVSRARDLRGARARPEGTALLAARERASRETAPERPDRYRGVPTSGRTVS